MRLWKAITRRLLSNNLVSYIAKKSFHILPRLLRKRIEYRRISSKVRIGLQLIDEEELLREYRRAVDYLIRNIGSEAIGDYLEFGVFYGSSLSCMNSALQENLLDSVRLFGFDSFEGLPESEYPDDTKWKPGWFKSSYEFAQDYLTKNGIDWHRTHLIKGWYSDTLNQETIQRYKIKKASLIMIDCDMYKSARQALQFCIPLIHDETIIFFDDWNALGLADENLGEKRAFEEFLEGCPHLAAEPFGSYTYKGKPNARVFRVINKENKTTAKAREF